MVCARMRNGVNLAGAQAMVMVVGLRQDEILQLSMGKGKPVCHVMPMPMDWVVFFTPNLWHGVWKANPEATGARASITYRGYLAPEFLKDSVVTQQDATDLFEVPVDLEGPGVQVFTLSAGFLIAVSPRRHHQKHHFFEECKMSWDVLPESRHCPGDRRACQAGPQFNFREGGVSGHVAIPPALETSMATSMSWPPMCDYRFWINQAIYNWYPGDDHDWYTMVPWHVRKPNANKARKNRRARNAKEGVVIGL